LKADPLGDRMKRILLTFTWIIVGIADAMAQIPLMTDPQTDIPAEPMLKPIKVSEINANLFSAIYDFFQKVGSNLFEGFVSLKDFVEVEDWLITSLKAPEMRAQVASFSAQLTLSIIVSFGLAWMLSSWLKPRIYALLDCKTCPSAEKARKLMLAALLSTFPPLVFGFFLYALARLINPSNEVYLEIARILSSGSVTIWILLNVAHLFLKPLTPNHKHIPLSQEVSATSYMWIRRMAMVALFGFFAFETSTLIHLPASGERLLLQGTGCIIAVMAVLMMVSLHQEVKEWIHEQRQNPRLSRLKRALLPYLEFSYVPIIVFIVISYVSWLTPEYDHFQLIVWKSLLTLALLPLSRIAAFCLRKVRILYIHKNLRRLSPSVAERAIFYGRQIDFVTITLFNGALLLFVLDLWGFDPAYFIFSTLGRSLAEKTFSIFTIIVVALFLTRAGNSLLTKYLSTPKNNLNTLQRQKLARFKTIYSVSRNVLRIAVWTPAVLLIIVELGMDIVPLLATVGILSLGLSLGMQTLVKDLATGFFMLLEDAFAVGDLVVINGQMGRIESLTVRVVRVRATDGSLYTFPYGNIASLCNQNRDFSAAVIFFRVGLDANIDQVFDILEKISKDLRKDSTTRKLPCLGDKGLDKNKTQRAL
jgi:hypothetical protein